MNEYDEQDGLLLEDEQDGLLLEEEKVNPSGLGIVSALILAVFYYGFLFILVVITTLTTSFSFDDPSRNSNSPLAGAMIYYGLIALGASGLSFFISVFRPHLKRFKYVVVGTFLMIGGSISFLVGCGNLL